MRRRDEVALAAAMRRGRPEPGTVIIIAPLDDLHANAVESRIRQLWPDGVRVFRLDLATYPIATGLGWELGRDGDTIRLEPSGFALVEGIGREANHVVAGWPRPSARVDANEILGIWWRRPRAPLFHPDVVEPEYASFCVRAANVTFQSFLEAMPCVHNIPHRELLANHKPYQLHLAREAGLGIPETLITANEAEVREFERRLSSRGLQLIFKSIVNDAGLALPTRRLGDADRARLSSSLHYAPGIFQEFVDGVDLRIAVLDDVVFCCEWRPAEAEPCSDIRLLEGARMWPSSLPPGLEAPLLRLHRRLGLTFGIYDFRMREGRPIFLEVNPSGQWLDMEIEARCPLTDAWAHKLAGREVDRHRLAPVEEARIASLELQSRPPLRGWRPVL